MSPHRIRLLLSLVGIAACIAPVDGQEHDLSEVTRLAQGALVGENVGEPVPGFEIRILRNGQPIYHQAFGAWSIDRVASIDSSSKTIVGAAIMSLTESSPNPFDLDTRLSEYLVTFNTQEKRDITIRQAFSHTSGFEPGMEFWALYADSLTLRQAANFIALEPLAHAPGTAFDYGSISMHAAGAAAEAAAGIPFVDLFAERITEPLGLGNTRFYAASDTNPRIDGGVESTASDYSRFMDALLLEGRDRVTGRRILSATSVQTMFTRQTTDAMPIFNSPVDNNRYGIGTWLNQLAQHGPPVPAMAGGARGFHSWIEPSRGVVFTFATDTTHFENVEELSSLMHAEIVRVIPELQFDAAKEIRDWLVVPSKDGLPARFTGAATGGYPFGIARLQASIDLGISDAWTDVATTELNGYGDVAFTDIPDTRPQALGSPTDFFRILIQQATP